MTAPPAESSVLRSADLLELAVLTRQLFELNQDLVERVARAALWPLECKVTIGLFAVAESFSDLALWAERHGGVIRACTRRWAASGEPYRACSVSFEVAGYRVEISANLPLSFDQTIPLTVDCP